MTNPEPLNATVGQFEKVVLRMMPAAFSGMPEGRLIAAIFGQAWEDADKRFGRKFFLHDESALGMYCEKTGLDASQIRDMFVKHCGKYKTYLKEYTNDYENPASCPA